MQNPICHQREMDLRQRLHRERVANIRPTSSTNHKCALDNNRPKRRLHLRYNAKRLQQKKERKEQIKRANQVLVTNLAKIRRETQDQAAMEFEPGLRVGKGKKPILDCYVSEKTIFAGQAKGKAWKKKFAVDVARKRHHDAYVISQENRAMLDRLEEKERHPTYPSNAWDKVREDQEGLLGNIAFAQKRFEYAAGRQVGNIRNTERDRDRLAAAFHNRRQAAVAAAADALRDREEEQDYAGTEEQRQVREEYERARAAHKLHLQKSARKREKIRSRKKIGVRNGKFSSTRRTGGVNSNKFNSARRQQQEAAAEEEADAEAAAEAEEAEKAEEEEAEEEEAEEEAVSSSRLNSNLNNLNGAAELASMHANTQARDGDMARALSRPVSSTGRRRPNMHVNGNSNGYVNGRVNGPRPSSRREGNSRSTRSSTSRSSSSNRNSNSSSGTRLPSRPRTAPHSTHGHRVASPYDAVHRRCIYGPCAPYAPHTERSDRSAWGGDSDGKNRNGTSKCNSKSKKSSHCNNYNEREENSSTTAEENFEQGLINMGKRFSSTTGKPVFCLCTSNPCQCLA